MWDIKLKLIETNNSMVAIRGKGWGAVKGKGSKYMVMEGDLTLGGGDTSISVQHTSTDHVS